MNKKNKPSPSIEGELEISHGENGIFIGGTPKGLKSLAKVLNWIAEFDQEIVNMPDGERTHIHLHVKNDDYGSLSEFSEETEVCRLDAKGTEELPSYYSPKKK